MGETSQTQAQASHRLSRALGGGARFVRARRDFVPAYLKAYELGLLTERAKAAQELLHPCKVCPRDCQVNRLENKAGVCKTGRYARVSSAFPHLGEEDCLRGWRGSGTIFFAGCNLGCVFCQNYEISQLGDGQELDADQLAAVMLRLQAAGCHNINFVTPEHVVPQILEALLSAIPKGLRLPLVYNTGAYDSLESIRLMDGVVDIYMPDFKLWDAQACAKYLRARDYPEAARRAIKAMHEQVGVLIVDEDGLALRGVLVRHLVMPGLIQDTQSILHWLASALSPDTYVNLMGQYHPAHKAETEPQFGEISHETGVPQEDILIERGIDELGNITAARGRFMEVLERQFPAFPVHGHPLGPFLKNGRWEPVADLGKPGQGRRVVALLGKVRAPGRPWRFRPRRGTEPWLSNEDQCAGQDLEMSVHARDSTP